MVRPFLGSAKVLCTLFGVRLLLLRWLTPIFLNESFNLVVSPTLEDRSAHTSGQIHCKQKLFQKNDLRNVDI